MRHRFAVAIASLAILASGPARVAAHSAAPSEVVKIPTSFTLNSAAKSMIQACVGESVTFEGTSLMVATETYLADGSLLLAMIHFNGQGSVAIGSTTGTVYRIVGADTTDLVFGPGALTASFEANLLAIGPGDADNFTGHILQHITITPAGEITSEIEVVGVTCG